MTRPNSVQRTKLLAAAAERYPVKTPPFSSVVAGRGTRPKTSDLILVSCQKPPVNP